MRTLTAIAALVFSAVAASAADGDDSRFREIGDCMAYYAIVSGMDGKKQVDAGMSSLMSTLGNEFMFEASVLGYEDDKAHQYVVSKLVEMNMLASEQGTNVLVARDGGKCETVAASVKG